MQRVIGALQAWREAQAQALTAEAALSVALDAELAGGATVPGELQARVKQCRARAEQRFEFAMSLMESRPDLTP